MSDNNDYLDAPKRQFSLKVPCSNCPFRNDDQKFMGLHPERVSSIIADLASGETGSFPCHKTVAQVYNDEGELVNSDVMKRKHCAGAMAVALKADAMPLIVAAGLVHGLIEVDHYDEAKQLTIEPHELLPLKRKSV
jgi:hypothetical protein